VHNSDGSVEIAHCLLDKKNYKNAYFKDFLKMKVYD